MLSQPGILTAPGGIGNSISFVGDPGSRSLTRSLVVCPDSDRKGGFPATFVALQPEDTISRPLGQFGFSPGAIAIEVVSASCPSTFATVSVGQTVIANGEAVSPSRASEVSTLCWTLARSHAILLKVQRQRRVRRTRPTPRSRPWRSRCSGCAPSDSADNRGSSLPRKARHNRRPSTQL